MRRASLKFLCRERDSWCSVCTQPEKFTPRLRTKITLSVRWFVAQNHLVIGPWKLELSITSYRRLSSTNWITCRRALPREPVHKSNSYLSQSREKQKHLFHHVTLVIRPRNAWQERVRWAALQGKGKKVNWAMQNDLWLMMEVFYVSLNNWRIQ